MYIRGPGCHGCSRMPCEGCGVQFSVFRRKRACSECERLYCGGCLRRGGGAMCGPCRALSTRPLARAAISHLKVRDLQCFLQRQNVSTRGCVEKEELVSLCVSHVNGAAYRRRGRAGGASPFAALKGFTDNINDFINSFELRSSATPATPAPRAAPPAPTAASPSAAAAAGGCFNSAHAHASRASRPPRPELFTSTPGGEPRIDVPVPGERGAGSGGGSSAGSGAGSSAGSGGGRVDTADCFEVEDLDDAWELVARPADPLPNDSDVLLAATDSPLSPPRRASSSLELRAAPAPGPRAPRSPSTGDETLLSPPSPRALDHHDDGEECDDSNAGGGAEEGGGAEGEQGEQGEQGEEGDALERMSVRELKRLLARNRVSFAACLERGELLERARRLAADRARYPPRAAEHLPLEDSCKICMAAPLECVLLECGHIAACTACSKQLAECPICRQYVVRAVRFFRS